MTGPVVVTGASGFLGRVLVAVLAGRGHHVVAASRASLPGGEYGAIIAPAGAVLVHLAEPRDIAGAEADPEAHLAATTGILDGLLAQPWAHVVYASSAAVYGGADQRVHRPTDPVSPGSAYGRAKLACERMVLAAAGTVVRLANLYGPGMAPNNVLSDILSQVGGQGPLTLKDTSPVRDFLWVDDAAAAIALAVDRRPGGVLNLGSGLSVAVGQLAGLALRMAGQGHRPVVSARPPHGSASCLYLDISDTVQLLDWVPETSLEQGFRRLLAVGPTDG